MSATVAKSIARLMERCVMERHRRDHAPYQNMGKRLMHTLGLRPGAPAPPHSHAIILYICRTLITLFAFIPSSLLSLIARSNCPVARRELLDVIPRQNH
jgi:hypothetical protein